MHGGKARELRRRLRRLPKGCLKVGGIQIPAAFEPEHLLLSGAPGTGKTNILHVMLEGIRKEGKRAIVYDTAGSFVERFYRPGKDIILNPFDSRSSQWAPWMDAPIDYHYDQIAESVVPDSGKDPFWAKSARGTLVAVMRGLKEQNCVIDELPSLQRLPSLSDFLARARKYGGCGILRFQSYPQLEATYGRQEAAALTGYCSTWVALRANDEPTARHISSNLGQVEQVEANEGMSYGVNDMRDGVSLSRTQVTRPLVLPTEIVNLPNLTGYLRFGRDLPVIRFTDRYHPAKADQPAYVDRTQPAVRLEPIEPETLDPTAANAPDDVDSSETSNDRHRPTDIRLIGQRSGADGGSIQQQSRPNGPFGPANPA